MMPSLLEQIRHGDKVTIVDRSGKQSTGRAVMYNPKVRAWVLNMGGKYGRPALADDSNITRVKGTRQ